MNIAIVGPSPVPFGIGGMEYLLWGMQENINNLTEHKVELIKLPTKETDFWEVINSYKQFYHLDVSHFDMVITTKYPAWMIQHPNHICYMAHRLRGLYDTYHFMNLPQKPERNHPLINKVLDYIEDEESTIDGLFELLEECYNKKDSLPAEHMAFPSPFSKEIIHFLDDKALKKAKKFYAISKTVKSRKEYFPKDAKVEVVYPPSALPQFQNRPHGDYLFTISRLDGAKRIGLIIEAMKYVKSDVKLKIAGTGPDEARLKELAKGDSRIEFLGFVNDDEAIEYYGNAKGVVFIPYEEDYGLVTIEAMMSHRPVITCYDSGGTTEFVDQGRTGYISTSEAQAIADSINKLCDLSAEEIAQMGDNCYEKVKNINWHTVASSLTDTKNIKQVQVVPRRKMSKKIVLTSTFGIYPAQGGGQVRTYELMKNLGKTYDVEIVSLGHFDRAERKEAIAPHVTETSIPRSIRHQEEDINLEREVGVHAADIGAALYIKYTPKYETSLKHALKDADLAIISHPFLIEVVQRCNAKMPFIYDAQDVEYLIKKELLKESKSKKAKELIQKVYELEKYCCENSEFIMTCSDEDKESILRIYEVPEEKVLVVPNGVDTSATQFVSMKERQKNKVRMGLGKQKLGIFMGSWHPPNLEACEHIIDMAEECPDTIFLLVGSQCLYFKDRILPDNVGLLGLVSESVKNDIFGVVDFALNPILSGSGTNLKMFDYMAAGIPIITTEFGTRGIQQKHYFTISNIEGMAKVVNDFEPVSASQDVGEMRKYVEDVFSWENISRGIIERIEK